MSYKYGLNGNDLNWDAMMTLDNFCLELERGISDGEIELNEDGYVSDEVYEGVMDSNPIMVYYFKKDGDLDIQEFLKSGNHISKHVDFAIVHDTNGNFVDLIGDVSDEYFTDEYVKEKNENLKV